MVHETITSVMHRSEVIHIDVPVEPKLENLHDLPPWEWLGAFKEDPTWGELFDEIERRRDGDGT